MPKLQNFEILYDRLDAIYAPGEIVTGKVIVDLSDPKNVREVRLKIRGKAKVHWEERRYSSRDKRTHTHHYRNKEIYFKVFNSLAGSGSDGETTLPAGQHTYPFSFQLPVDIPSSFEHKYAYIRYTIKAILDRPWRFDHEVGSTFVVVAPYDLSTRQIFARGIYEEIQEDFLSCCCFDAGFMKIVVSSKTTGFAPRETFELIVNHDRSSTQVAILSMHLKLIKNLKFRTTLKNKHKSETLKEVYGGGPYDKKGETALRFIVPDVTPSNVKNCSIIDIHYELDLTITVSGMHSNITRCYPVKIWI